MEVIAPHRDDVELLAAAAAGELDAVRQVIDDIGPVVYGFVFARVGGRPEAEDIVQDVFLEAMRSHATFRGEAALTTWMCTIARRRLARHYERERRQAAAHARLAPVAEVISLASIDHDAARSDELVRAMGTLPPLQRQVLVMKYLDDRPVDDVARELGRTPVQVQSLLQRARAGMRRALGSERD